MRLLLKIKYVEEQKAQGVIKQKAKALLFEVRKG